MITYKISIITAVAVNLDQFIFALLDVNTIANSIKKY